ncbi:hypothetical protein CGCSCA4_v008797 [Colletotrichum siamense]|uniref:DUF6594 domain-containing protein n=1 Tax=Colletotrichum siamense TaxID=690259 RepID=A0A9P5ESA3_COLSI|nr:hypothetical protein CGCSCA4_v008797 [Colletotrichum siamense]KAF4858398.1 hypothetical protein CGCSCA2_v007378 [Colletotrichum siamense]
MNSNESIPATHELKAVPGRIREGMGYAERMFHYSWQSGAEDLPILEYRTLSKMNIFHLQNELAKLKASVWTGMSVSQDNLAKLRVTMHAYANAIRDYEHLRALPEIAGSQAADRRRDLTTAFPWIADLPGDPYNSKYRTLSAPSFPEANIDPLRRFLKARLPRGLTYTKEEMRVRIDEYLAHRPPKTVSPLVDKLARFIISFAGGASLIVPMLIMRLPGQDTTKSLIVTSVAVTLFSGLMGLVFKVSNAETVVATATYAAVLVVFVGTSSS